MAHPAHPGQPALLLPETALARVAEAQAAAFRGVLSPETVRRYVQESYDALYFRSAATQHLVPLVEKFVAERLTALAQANGLVVKAVPEVLFVCEHNAGRSQLAAALLTRAADGRVHVRSAGSAPTADVELRVVEVLEEVGLDVAAEYPKPLTDEVVRAADVVITMGCQDACPVYPGKRYLDWGVADPAGQPVEAVRAIREDIDARVRVLLNELVSPLPDTEGTTHV